MFRPSRMFISYRRSDGERTARSVCEALRRRFGADRVFFDTSDIPYGDDFSAVIRERIASSDVVLPVIGPAWLAARNARGPRLAQADDPVRFEIETALGLHKRIVPIRIDGAAAPTAGDLPASLQPLAALNMPDVRLASFDIDVAELVRQLLGEPRTEVGTWTRVRAALRGAPVLAVALVATLLAASFTGALNAFGLGTAVQRLLLAAADAPTGEPVLLVGIDQASEQALQPFTTDNAPAWRRAHARLIDRAASAGAATVAFDISFKSAAQQQPAPTASQAEALDDADRALADAARRAGQRSPPMRVVFGASQGSGREPLLSEPLRRAAPWGSLCLYDIGDGAQWSVALAVLRPTLTQGERTTAADTPALALSAVVGEPLLEANEADRELRFAGTTRNPPVRYSAVERQRRTHVDCPLTRPGDDLLMMRLRIAPDGHWRNAARSVSYVAALDSAKAPDALFKGRIVLIGSTQVERNPRPDVKTVVDGFTPRNLFGVELQADAVRALATGHVPQLPTLDRQAWTSLLACALGGAVAVRLFDAPAWRRRSVLLAVALAWLAAAWWLARRDVLLDVVSDLLAIAVAAMSMRALQLVAWRFRALRRITS